MGIRTILSLRGTARNSPQLFEAEDCAALGLTLVSTGLHARAPSSRAALLRLFDLWRSIDGPFLMHCKSGADRAGLASALYLIGIEGRSVAEARAQLSFRFLHVKASETGILDHMLDLFEQRQAETGVGIEAWIATEYDPAALAESWRASRRGGRR
jgi:protein tyrosine/serine phosphatase